MADTWSAPAVIVSTIGVIVTGAVGWVTWLNYRLLRSSDRVIVRADLSWNDKLDDTLSLNLSLENVTESKFTTLQLKLIRPRSILMLNLYGVHIRSGYHKAKFESEEDAFSALAKPKIIELGGNLAPAGEQGALIAGSRIGPSDRTYRNVYLRGPALAEGTRLSMRVILLSNDARRRKVTVPIKRMVPPRISTETS